MIACKEPEDGQGLGTPQEHGSMCTMHLGYKSHLFFKEQLPVEYLKCLQAVEAMPLVGKTYVLGPLNTPLVCAEI